MRWESIAFFMCVTFCGASFAVAPLSQYGQIQNVQTYSTNPFYQKGIYNPKAPQPVYATGTDLNSADCRAVVTPLVAAQCAMRNNCVGARLSDIRPTVMLQLSQIPGHNYATSCAGFIDGAFEDYARAHGVVTHGAVNFPPVQEPATGAQMNNPYIAKQNFPAPAKQIAPLNANGKWLAPTEFAKTVADISLADRIAVQTEGYEPFKDLSAYRGLVVEGEEEFMERMVAMGYIEQQQDKEKLSDTEYCKKYPLDSAKCKQNTNTLQDVINIGSASVSPTSFSGKTIGGGAVVVANNTHGGSCFPAAKNATFKNQIMTTGQFESISPEFEKAMITVFRKEGECGTIPNDPCGYTCYGLGSGPKCMNMDVSKLTRADAEKIYYERWWKKYNIGILPDVISGDVFLACMASGPCTAINQFRKFLGLSQNCKIDNEVVAAVEKYQGDIHNDWLNVRQKFLVEVAERKYQNSVLKGWMNAIKLKRENGCHVIPSDPLYR